MPGPRIMEETVFRGSDNVVECRFRIEQVSSGLLFPMPWDSVTRVVFKLDGFNQNPIYDTDLLDGQEFVDRSREPGFLDVQFGRFPNLPRGYFPVRLEAYQGLADAEPTQLLHEQDQQQRLFLRIFDR